MTFFRRTKSQTYGVVDAGSNAIKALIFDVPAPMVRLVDPVRERISNGVERMVPVGQGPNSVLLQQRSISAAVRPIEKFVWELPASFSAQRLARKIRECVFHLAQRAESAPERIIVGLGPTAAECALYVWRIAPVLSGAAMLTRRDIRAAYEELSGRETDMRRAAIVTPVEVCVNGYSLEPGDRGTQENILPRAAAREISFRTLALFMSVENGAVFADMRQAMSGIRIEFVPLVAAEKEAMIRGMGVKDALVVDVGGNETSILSIRDGKFSHAAFIPYGTRRMAEALARQTGRPFADADKDLRAYAGTGYGPGAPATKEQAAASAGAAQWKMRLAAALSGFAAAGPVAPAVWLTGGGARFPEFRAAVQTSDWIANASYAQRPALRVLDGAAFFGGDTLGGYLSGPEDTGLAALMLYATAHKPLV